MKVIPSEQNFCDLVNYCTITFKHYSRTCYNSEHNVPLLITSIPFRNNHKNLTSSNRDDRGKVKKRRDKIELNILSYRLQAPASLSRLNKPNMSHCACAKLEVILSVLLHFYIYQAIISEPVKAWFSTDSYFR